MLKVVIADDEQMICSLIVHLLDWESLGFTIAGTAYTGVDALNMILREKPDIVISDIRMPGYDGLDLIRHVQEAGIETEFIMISGFKQFEYAQTAMKYGVRYYLLKPIEEERLLESVLEIRDSIADRNARTVYKDSLERRIKENRDRMKKRLLTALLRGDPALPSREETDRERINGEYGTAFAEGVCRALIVKLDIEGDEEKSIYSVMAEMRKHIDTLGSVCEEYITAEMRFGMAALFNYKSGLEEEIRRRIQELYENVRSYAERFQGFSVVIGVGKRTEDLRCLGESVATAADAVKYRIRIRTEGVIYYEKYQFRSQDIDKIVTVSKRQQFLSKIESGDGKAASEMLMAALREIRHGGGDYSPVCCFDTARAYVEELAEYCRRSQIFDESCEERLRKWGIRMDNVRSEKRLMEVSGEFITETMEHIARIKKEKDVRPIRRAKKYIEENYMKDISLGQLAEKIDMNASYLSVIFKKETGMTYSEYLTHCRIENARRLLIETDKSVSEIAKLSGYQEARYFSRQFFKQVGLKPTEYRKLYS